MSAIPDYLIGQPNLEFKARAAVLAGRTLTQYGYMHLATQRFSRALPFYLDTITVNIELDLTCSRT